MRRTGRVRFGSEILRLGLCPPNPSGGGVSTVDWTAFGRGVHIDLALGLSGRFTGGVVQEDFGDFESWGLAKLG